MPKPKKSGPWKKKGRPTALDRQLAWLERERATRATLDAVSYKDNFYQPRNRFAPSTDLRDRIVSGSYFTNREYTQ